MPDTLSYIKDLIIFYIKTNYNNYLSQNNIDFIKEDKIKTVVTELYSENKEHMRTFILTSMKKMLKEECPKELIINNILNDIYNDDSLNIQTLVKEISLYQKKMQKKSI